jgi:hypothetical protein
MRVDSLLVAEAALDGLCCCQAGSGLPICISGSTKLGTTLGIRPLGACCLTWGPDATLQVRGCRYKYNSQMQKHVSHPQCWLCCLLPADVLSDWLLILFRTHRDMHA